MRVLIVKFRKCKEWRYMMIPYGPVLDECLKDDIGRQQFEHMVGVKLVASRIVDGAANV